MFVKHNIGYSTAFSLKLTFAFANCFGFLRVEFSFAKQIKLVCKMLDLIV